MRFVHAADLHIDSPLRGLERYDGAPVDSLRGATRRALENLVDLCLERAVDALLLAGDLFDGDWRDYSTGLFTASQLGRLREAEIRVVVVRGNHDAASQITKNLRWPSNVIELATQAPQTWTDERLGLAIHGQGFHTREVTADLAALYPDALPGHFNVGLLHTSVDGREGHEPYAPTSKGLMTSKGYDYWALGHVHRREVLSEDPWILFSGNLQGRNARETGPKGATLVDVEDGRVSSVEHVPLDVVRWTRVEFDATEAETPDDVLNRAAEELERLAEEADGRLLAARLEIVGSSRAHSALALDPERWEAALRLCANEVSACEIWLEKVRVRTSAPLDIEALARRDDTIGQLVRGLRDIRTETDGLRALATEFADLERALPLEVRRGEDGFRVDADTLREAIEDVERTLLPRLLQRLGEGG